MWLMLLTARRISWKLPLKLTGKQVKKNALTFIQHHHISLSEPSQEKCLHKAGASAICLLQNSSLSVEKVRCNQCKTNECVPLKTCLWIQQADTMQFRKPQTRRVYRKSDFNYSFVSQPLCSKWSKCTEYYGFPDSQTWQRLR